MWRHLIVTDTAAESRLGQVAAWTRTGGTLPHGVAWVARQGNGFRGFRGRSWVASPGNLHLTVHLAPGVAVPRFETAFTVLAALSVLDAVDRCPGLEERALLRWVNDIVVEGAKVGGVLAHTASRGEVVNSATLGIGLNVETLPEVPPTPFVPAVGSLRSFSPRPEAVTLGAMLREVLWALGRNYLRLLREGYAPLMERYRSRSVVLGQEVTVSSDDPDEVPRVVAAGRVEAIGDGLDLRLAGWSRPVTGGRLLVQNP